MAAITVWGLVGSNGKVLSGSGFRVQHDIGTGEYTILFDSSFNVLPAVVTTQAFPNRDGADPGDPRDNSVVVYIDNDRFRAITGEDNGDRADRDFSFIAMGG
jgi:hypothetical protein